MNATMIAPITTMPASAVAARSICLKRSSRPSPRRPRIVSLRLPPTRITAPNTDMIPSETSPAPGWPALHCAASITSPSATANRGWNHFDLVICIEHLLHCGTEETRERQGERQRRRVLARLDRVDRLPRDLERRAELGLRQPPRHSSLPHVVLHACQVSLTRSTMSSELDFERVGRRPPRGGRGGGRGLADAGLAELDAEVDLAAGRGLRELELDAARGALAGLLHHVRPAGREDGPAAVGDVSETVRRRPERGLRAVGDADRLGRRSSGAP